MLWKIEKSIKRKLFWKSEFDRSSNNAFWSVLRLARQACSDDREMIFFLKGEDRFKEICLRWREVDGPSMRYTPERAVFQAHREFADWFVENMWDDDRDGQDLIKHMAAALRHRAMQADDYRTDRIESLMGDYWFGQLDLNS